jgi:hypothetical protein
MNDELEMGLLPDRPYPSFLGFGCQLDPELLLGIQPNRRPDEVCFRAIALLALRFEEGDLIRSNEELPADHCGVGRVLLHFSSSPHSIGALSFTYTRGSPQKHEKNWRI